MRMLPLDLIVLDDRAQPRLILNLDIVQEFAEDMVRGDVLPPVDVFFDGTEYFLASGWHRFHAHQAMSRPTIACTVHDGTLEDAIWFSLASNRENGVRRTQADVRNAVRRALLHRKGRDESDRVIADYVGCAPNTVRALRQQSVANAQIAQSQSRVDKNGVERVLPQPRAPKPEPEVAAANAAADPEQIDLEDYPGVAQPQPLNYVDRSNDWIHNAVKAVATAMKTLPPPDIAVARYPVGVGYTLPVRDAEAILDWWAEFVPLWAERFPEFQAQFDKMTRLGQEIAREHAE